MARGKAVAIVLSDRERVELERRVRRRKSSHGAARRARIVLLAADGLSNLAIAEKLGVSRRTVGLWRARFAERRLGGLVDEPRPGAPRKIGDDKIAEVVRGRWRRCPTVRPTGAAARWPGRRASPRRRCTVSGAPSACSRTGSRASSCRATLSSSTRCATSSASISTRRTARWCSASTRRARSRRSTAPSRCCPCGRARRSGAATITSATARPPCSPPSTPPPARSSGAA